jgi:uncharacterized protein (TIGR02391 family)
MNLETRIELRLWEYIKGQYENGNYKGAILDSIFFLGDLIREKTGLEGDGVQLVGQAFGGKVPVLKVNKLQSESDRNIQTGIEQILRGIFLSIRNPRSHEKSVDTIEDAEAIIVFVNYLLGIINWTEPLGLDKMY